MDVKFINPFLESLASVMPMLGLTDVKKKGMALKGRNVPSLGVMVIVGIMGDISGNIMYSTSIDDAKKIASAMMMGMPVNELNELSKSAITELTNMLTAKAATNFSKIDIDINISTPSFFYGNFSASSCSDKVICVEMLVNNMVFEVNIALERTRL